MAYHNMLIDPGSWWLAAGGIGMTQRTAGMHKQFLKWKDIEGLQIYIVAMQ